ncbi:MAG: AEC family transporter [Promethearchaeota archaeon]|nr:MAG: AEC family transporter [Candidatus Lokiarchaeota archaeon]
MTGVNYNFLLAIVVIAIGFILKSGNVISEKNGKVIAKLVFNITLPCVIFRTIVSITITPQLFLLAVIPVIYASVLFLIAYIFLRKKELSIKGLSLMSVMGFNVVHLAFPLIEGIWGQEGLKYIAMFDVGNGFVIFLMSYLVGSIFSPKNNHLEKKQLLKEGFKKIGTSGPLIAYFIALPLNLVGLIIPQFFSDIINKFADANSALTLLLLGIFLNFKFESHQWKQIGRVLLIRYSFGLFIGLLLFFLLPFELLYRGILVIGLILPIGLAVIPFTVEFLFDEKVAGTLVNISIIISFAMMWILILVLDFG